MIPTTPASITWVMLRDSASRSSVKPPSKSTDSGRSVARLMAAAEEVAIALAPASATITALATSQALGRTSTSGPWCN